MFEAFVLASLLGLSLGLSSAKVSNPYPGGESQMPVDSHGGMFGEDVKGKTDYAYDPILENRKKLEKAAAERDGAAAVYPPSFNPWMVPQGPQTFGTPKVSQAIKQQVIDEGKQVFQEFGIPLDAATLGMWGATVDAATLGMGQ